MASVSKTNARNGTSPSGKARATNPPRTIQEHLMWDVVMLALGLGFFAIAIGYSYACERL
jgi:hypothetical protein